MPFDAERLIKDAGAIVHGPHIVSTHGLHSTIYIDKRILYSDTITTSLLCRELADHFQGLPIDSVVAPAIGGIILAQWTAHYLTHMRGHTVRAIFAEKIPGGFELKSNYARHVAGKNCLVVEDILTTGGSVRKVVDLVRSEGGTVAAVGALWNRGDVTKQQVGNPPHLFALVTKQLEAWQSSECPVCNPKR